MEHLRRIPANKLRGHKRSLKALLQSLVDSYVTQALSLADRLQPVVDTPYGLALSLPSEKVDYPLRVLRLSGYLATAGLALHKMREIGKTRRLVESLKTIWGHNEGAVLQPVTDDQLIEIALVWELWALHGESDFVGESAVNLLNRLAIRKACGNPLPAVGQKARIPPLDQDLRALVEAHSRGGDRSAWFSDDCSTILPLAVYAASRTGHLEDDSILKAFVDVARDPAGARETPNQESNELITQSWLPPGDAPAEWYAHEIQLRGVTKVHDISIGATAFVEEFESFHVPLPATPAEAWGLPCIDRMAWKVFRTPPPMFPIIRRIR